MIKILHFCTNQIIGIIIIEIHFKKRQALCRSIPFTTGKIKKNAISDKYRRNRKPDHFQSHTVSDLKRRTTLSNAV